MKTLLTRALSGAIYVLLIITSIYAGRWMNNITGGEVVFGVLFLAIGIIGTHEVLKNLSLKGINANKPTAYIVGILSYLIVFFWEQPTFSEGQLWSLSLLTMLPALMLCVFLAQLWRNDENPIATIGYTILPTIWVMIPLALTNYIHDSGYGLMMMVFILVWVNDTFAYLTGMLIGRHKMWERHSPKKTWEGTIGGAAFCIATAIFVGPLFHSNGVEMNVVDWAVIGFICSAIGTLGDLVESMFKRFCGVKDSGNIRPGHGGILDRVDSILLAVPFVQAYLVIVV